MLPGGAESAIVAKGCAGRISGEMLVAIFYFYTADSKRVRRERRCEKVDGGRSRTNSGGERGGVLTAARGGGKEIVRQARVPRRPTLTDNTKGKRKETAKGDAKKTRNGPFAKQRQVAVSGLLPTVGWRREKGVEVLAR